MNTGLVIHTEFGWMAIIRGPNGIQRTSLPVTTREEAMLKVGLTETELATNTSTYADLVRRLQRYFCGEAVQFPDALDYGSATLFQCAVWESVRTIPYGETRSYSWVAEQVNRSRAYRAVGRAVGLNPLPILVPCHRVLRSDGALGGFGGGIELKQRLLALEQNGDSP